MRDRAAQARDDCGIDLARHVAPRVEDSSSKLQPKECCRRYLRDFILMASESMGEAKAHCETAMGVSSWLAAGNDERI